MTRTTIHDEDIIDDTIANIRECYVILDSNGNGELDVRNTIKQYAEHYLIKFLDSEIERLEKLKHDNPLLGTSAEVERVMEAANLTITDQITHLKNVKENIQ